MNLLRRFNKLKQLLFILQQEEYQASRFRDWLAKHPDGLTRQTRQSLSFTPKALGIFILSTPLALILPPAQALLLTLQLLSPLDRCLKKILLFLAQQHLKRLPNLLVIGITGSYGKTSTKNILRQLLEKTALTPLATPASFNTPLGIAQVINRQLRKIHRIFIVEMGAYQRGEIRQLCTLVHPQIGILTAIGPMHLERFGSMENIRQAKSELIHTLPPDGLAILNGDDEEIKKLAAKIKKRKAIYSVKQIIRQGRTTQAKIEIALPDSRLVELDFETALLGQGQISNVAAATTAALALGVDKEKIEQHLQQIKPLPHRLQLIDPGSGILIIDNTYSSNPQGFKEALRVLDSFEARRKILVTPGIVELGPLEQDVHQELGRKAGQVCDLVILTGQNSRTQYLQEGLRRVDFPEEKIYNPRSLTETEKLIQEVGRPLDIFLLENDLPEKYL